MVLRSSFKELWNGRDCKRSEIGEFNIERLLPIFIGDQYVIKGKLIKFINFPFLFYAIVVLEKECVLY